MFSIFTDISLIIYIRNKAIKIIAQLLLFEIILITQGDTKFVL